MLGSKLGTERAGSLAFHLFVWTLQPMSPLSGQVAHQVAALSKSLDSAWLFGFVLCSRSVFCLEKEPQENTWWGPGFESHACCVHKLQVHQLHVVNV